MTEQNRRRMDILMECQHMININTQKLNWDDINGEYRIMHNGKTWKQVSDFDRDFPVSVWAEQFDKCSVDTIFFIFGIGHLGYITELNRRFPHSIKIFFEPSDDIIIKLTARDDFDGINELKNTYIIAGENKFDNLNSVLYTLINYDNMNKLFLGRIPNYHKIWTEEYQEYARAISFRLDSVLIEKRTRILHEESRAKNYLYNIQKLIEEAGVIELSRPFHAESVEDNAAVIISAGPSLDKNIHQLKEYQGKVFVICVDVALKTAYKHGIRPDIVVAVDPDLGEMDIMEEEDCSHMPLVTHTICSYEFLHQHRGRKFYLSDGDNYTKSILEKHHAGMRQLATGGSVANTAFSLAQIMGFRTIILVGQDLSYPNNQQHAMDSYENEAAIDENNEKYFYIDAIDGSKVLSEKNMCMYREWFENTIVAFPELHVIDATEGGALIKGTTIMPLKDALEKYSRTESYDFASLINKAPYFMNKSAQVQAREEIEKTIQGIDEETTFFKNKRVYYELLDELNKKGEYSSEQFREYLKEIKLLTDYIESHPHMAMYDIFVNETSYTVKDEMKKQFDSQSEEICMLVSAGMRMIDAYIRAGEKIKETWNELKEYEKFHGKEV
ncbi:MAG: DUF115 domain-containing protein [Lachnospiraceae bacterium]|nr:DUF115 domain-containing protein [Lachnospiraceae bacterium]